MVIDKAKIGAICNVLKLRIVLRNEEDLLLGHPRERLCKKTKIQ
jgi:hypothetical protein